MCLTITSVLILVKIILPYNNHLAAWRIIFRALYRISNEMLMSFTHCYAGGLI